LDKQTKTPAIGRPAAEENDERSRELAQAYAALLRGLAHELRTPLGSILMMAELVADSADERLQDGERDKLAKIQRAGADLKGVIEDVSVLAKVTGGQVTPETTKVRLGDVVKAVAERQDAAAGRAAVVVVGDENPEVRTDGLLLCRLLDALLNRAVDVTASRERVLLRVAGDEDGVTVTVADAGPALDEAELATLFEPFSAGQRRRQGGSSVTLTVARALAGLLDAELTASSGEKGTTLTLRFAG
jgi:signal transduction histidine kinase